MDTETEEVQIKGHTYILAKVTGYKPLTPSTIKLTLTIDNKEEIRDVPIRLICPTVKLENKYMEVEEAIKIIGYQQFITYLYLHDNPDKYIKIK